MRPDPLMPASWRWEGANGRLPPGHECRRGTRGRGPALHQLCPYEIKGKAGPGDGSEGLILVSEAVCRTPCCQVGAAPYLLRCKSSGKHRSLSQRWDHGSDLDKETGNEGGF